MKKQANFRTFLTAFTLLVLGSGISEAQVANDELDANNVLARVNAVGPLWFDGSSHLFEVPAGSGLSTMFASNLWVGGQSVNGQLHVAAERFRASGTDYFSGPIANPPYASINLFVFNRTWKLTRAQIDNHIANWSQSGYQAPSDLTTWPSHGDLTKGEAAQLAPFKDLNNNGVYEPQQGEYPIIRGDVAIYSIFNDATGLHTESGAAALGIEVHQMAYAFNCPLVANQHNTIYLNYRIINRSNFTFTDTYFGMWSDGDLGNGSDDYVGAMVDRGAYYFYNGDAFDESNGGKPGYGTAPPMQAVVFLGGPALDPDGVDNQPSVQIKGSVNGFGFNDGVADNERHGMSHFIFHNNNQSPLGDPSTGTEYYNYMRGMWRDGTHLTYGGIGYNPSDPNAVSADYMFPGASDPNGFGTSGQTQSNWDEVTAGNAPSDRRGLGSYGPITFSAQEEVELDFAFIYMRDLTATTTGAALVGMQDAVDFIRQGFANNNTGCGAPIFTAVEESVANSTVTAYPNPVENQLTLEISNFQQAVPYTLTDITGRVVREGQLLQSREVLDMTDLVEGLYHLRLQHAGSPETLPIMVR